MNCLDNLSKPLTAQPYSVSARANGTNSRLVREQFALLPWLKPHEIAEKLGIKYPVYPLSYTQELITSDYVLPAEIAEVLGIRFLKYPLRNTPIFVPIILSGMRKVDETVQFCDMRAGDRIGHAVALGIDPAAWILRVKEGFCSKFEFLDNLVWAVNQAPTNRRFRAKWKDVISKYNEGIAKLSKEIYGAEYSAASLYDAWHLRRNCPTCRDDNPKGPVDQYRFHAALDYGPAQVGRLEARELFRMYLQNATVYTKGEEKLLFRGHYGDGTANHVIDDEEVGFLHALQKHMLKRLADLKIAIECNVSSNTFIGSFDSFGEHPIFAWSPPNGARDHVGNVKKASTLFPNLCVCSDDPAIFCTSLQNEFHLLRETAARSKQKYHEQEIRKWLERLRKRGVRIFESTA